MLDHNFIRFDNFYYKCSNCDIYRYVFSGQYLYVEKGSPNHEWWARKCSDVILESVLK